MKYSAENAVSSFFYYMWNAWSKEECKVVFGGMCKHFWEKWNSQAGKSIYGAAERFYAELSECNRTLLVERAVSLYDGKAKRENLKMKTFMSAMYAVLFCLKSSDGLIWIPVSPYANTTMIMSIAKSGALSAMKFSVPVQ